MHLKVLSLAASVILSCPTVWAQASQLSNQTVELFTEIEHQYFGRNYSTETLDGRCQRLEKIMFGSVQDGSGAQRVTNIVDFVLKANTDTPDTPDTSCVDNGDEYPHITRLENLILGTAYVQDKLQDRLSRMETKAFSKVSTSNDMSARTDALDQYVQQRLKENPFQLNASTDQTSQQGSSTVAAANSMQGSDDDDDGVPDYPHIDSLEKQILGKTYIGQPLVDRLSRMEIKAYGKASPNPDLSQRTDDLDTYVENVLHIKSFSKTQERPDDSIGSDSDSQQTNAGGSPQRKKQIAALIGNSLLGMAGLGFLGGVMPPSMSPARRDDVQISNNQPTSTDDPLIYQPNIPPANTRMITKVGWCEVQTFGHTQSNLHLIDRLTQLNQKLNFAPGQSGMELMDDMDALMKKVVAEKQTSPTM